MTTRHARPTRGRRYLSAAVILGVAVALALVPSGASVGKGGGGFTNSIVYQVDQKYTGDNCPTALNGIPSAPGEGTFQRIQAAVHCAEAAGGGFTIQVAPGTYQENLRLGSLAYTDPFDPSPDPGQPSSLTIVSTGGAARTIIDGGDNGPVVASGLFDASFLCSVGACWQVTATIRGFTLTNGSGGQWIAANVDEILHSDTVVVGGGVFNGPGSNLTLVDDVVTGNDVTGTSDGYGGWLFGMGGGIFNDSFAKLTLSATTVRDNTASAGGGIAAAPTWWQCPMHYCFSGDVHVQSGSLITANRASEYGGGIMLTNHASLSVDASTLSHNVVGPTTGQWVWPWPDEIGGGIASVPSIWHDPFTPAGQVSLSGADVSYNTAPGGGGAMVNMGGQLTMSGGTMAYNATDGAGGALLNVYEGSASISNPTIKSNTAGTVGGGIASCLNGTMNLSGGRIQANIAGDPAPSGGGLNAEPGSPWSAVRTAIRGNLPDDQAAEQCGITIVLPLPLL